MYRQVRTFTNCNARSASMPSQPSTSPRTHLIRRAPPTCGCTPDDKVSGEETASATESNPLPSALLSTVDTGEHPHQKDEPAPFPLDRCSLPACAAIRARGIGATSNGQKPQQQMARKRENLFATLVETVKTLSHG